MTRDDQWKLFLLLVNLFVWAWLYPKHSRSLPQERSEASPNHLSTATQFLRDGDDDVIAHAMLDLYASAAASKIVAYMEEGRRIDGTLGFSPWFTEERLRSQPWAVQEEVSSLRQSAISLVQELKDMKARHSQLLHGLAQDTARGTRPAAVVEGDVSTIAGSNESGANQPTDSESSSAETQTASDIPPHNLSDTGASGSDREPPSNRTSSTNSDRTSSTNSNRTSYTNSNRTSYTNSNRTSYTNSSHLVLPLFASFPPLVTLCHGRAGLDAVLSLSGAMSKVDPRAWVAVYTSQLTSDQHATLQLLRNVRVVDSSTLFPIGVTSIVDPSSRGRSEGSGGARLHANGSNGWDDSADRTRSGSGSRSFSVQATLPCLDPLDECPGEGGIWRLAVLRDATERFGEAIMVDPSLLLTTTLSSLVSSLRERGFVVSCSSAGDAIAPAVVGMSRDSLFFRSTYTVRMRCLLTGGQKPKGREHCPEIPTDRPAMQYVLGGLVTDCVPQRHLPFALQMAKDKLPQCTLTLRPDILLTVNSLPLEESATKSLSRPSGRDGHISLGVGGDTPGDDDGPVVITFGVASYSAGADVLEDLTLCTELLDSLKETLDMSGKYTFRVYVGFDRDDPWYKDNSNRNLVDQYFRQLFPSPLVTLKWFWVSKSHGWTTYIWNTLFEYAVADGTDYFYQVNDDLRLLSTGWEDAFVDALSLGRVRVNGTSETARSLHVDGTTNWPRGFGVAGPKDIWNDVIMTQGFVHRAHYDVFGFFYPPSFRNWYSDDWLAHVYEPLNGQFWFTDILVHNTNKKGTRYSPCNDAGQATEEWELSRGAESILEWTRT